MWILVSWLIIFETSRIKVYSLCVIMPYASQATPPHRSRPRRQNRVADPVYGGEEAGDDEIDNDRYYIFRNYSYFCCRTLM